VLAQHGVDEFRALPDAPALQGVQIRLGAPAPRELARLHLPQHLQGYRIHPEESRRGAWHALRVRVLRRRPPLYAGALPRPQAGEAAAPGADHFRHFGRHRRRSGKPDPREADRRQAVRRRLLLVDPRRGPAPAAARHHGRDHGRQRPRWPRGFTLYRQGRAGQDECRAGRAHPHHPGEPVARDRHAAGGARHAGAQGRRRRVILSRSSLRMSDIADYQRPRPGEQPPYLYPDYGSTLKRAPKHAPLRIDHTLSEVTGPGFDSGWAGPDNADLTRQHKGTPIGSRMIVAGRVLDEQGRAVPRTLVELWQANAAGRYVHEMDQHDAPLDPNFTGAGQLVTNDAGEFRFITVVPGAYPWRNTHNAWRAQHLHFSVFGPAFATRLITQMFFPGDPLLEYDP